MNKSWVLFRQGFDKCAATRTERQRIVLSVEYCTVDVPQCASWFIGRGKPNSLVGCSAWLQEARVDLWRVKSDISPSFSAIVAGAECASLSRNLSTNLTTNPYGGFNDPDILEIGHPSLSPTEQRTHMSLWCILAAPLLVSTPLDSISNATLALLTAPEVIAVNQDPLGIQGMSVPCVGNGTGSETAKAWLKPLVNKTHALLLMNSDSSPQSITVQWSSLGLCSNDAGVGGCEYDVRDLWMRQPVGTVDESWSVVVDGHGSVLVGLSTST